MGVAVPQHRLTRASGGLRPVRLPTPGQERCPNAHVLALVAVPSDVRWRGHGDSLCYLDASPAD